MAYIFRMLPSHSLEQTGDARAFDFESSNPRPLSSKPLGAV